jgi:peptidyl-dipeptidase A
LAEAQSFLDRANAALLEAAVNSSHAEWLANTDINEGSEATSALLNEQGSALQLKLIEESHHFDKLTLPAPCGDR